MGNQPWLLNFSIHKDLKKYPICPEEFQAFRWNRSHYIQMSEYIELASDTEMISCWVAENNGWKYACHNTVPEQSCLIHICLGSQASSFLTAETVQWLICWQEKTFQYQMMWEHPQRLDATSVTRPCRTDVPHLPGALWPSSPSGASCVTCNQLATHCHLHRIESWRWGEAIGAARISGCTGSVRGKREPVWVLLSVLGTLWVLWLCDSIMML